MGTRALEGRRTEALVCRPSRAGRVLAPIFRWFLHRLISKAPPARKNIFLNAIGSSPTQSTPVRTLTEPYPGAHGTGSGSDRAPSKAPSPSAPGRYRSRYCTAACLNVAWFDLVDQWTRSGASEADSLQAVADGEPVGEAG